MEIAIENITTDVLKLFRPYLKSHYENVDGTYSIVIYANNFKMEHSRTYYNKSDQPVLYKDFITISISKGRMVQEITLMSNEFTKISVM